MGESQIANSSPTIAWRWRTPTSRSQHLILRSSGNLGSGFFYETGWEALATIVPNRFAIRISQLDRRFTDSHRRLELVTTARKEQARLLWCLQRFERMQ